MVKRQTQIITLSLLVGGWMLAADNSYNGSWKIDAPKSSWSNGRFPKNMSIVITLTFTGDELKYHSINDTNKEKQPNYADYTAKMDGKLYPFPNSARFNQVSVRRIGETEMEILEMKDDDVIVGAVYELMPGGKRFVRRGIAKGADGKSHEYEEFFDKQ
jgi:hypothetical protein